MDFPPPIIHIAFYSVFLFEHLDNAAHRDDCFRKVSLKPFLLLCTQQSWGGEEPLLEPPLCPCCPSKVEERNLKDRNKTI